MLKGTLLYYPNLLLIVVSTICASAFFKRSVTAGGVFFDQPYSLQFLRFYENTLGKYAPKGMTSAEEMIHRGTYSDHALTSFFRCIDVDCSLFFSSDGFFLENKNYSMMYPFDLRI